MSELAPNQQQLPAGLPGAAPAPAAPAYNPMLSVVTPPPTVEEAIKAPAVAAPAVAAPPVITIPVASGTAPAVPIGSLAQEFSADPQVNLATTYLDALATDGKLDVNRALAQALETGDFTRIDKAYINEVLKDKAGNFLQTAESLVKYVEHQRGALIASVYEAAGGEAQFETALNTWKQQASEAEQDVIRGLFDSGDAAKVKYAAQQIIQAATKAGVVINHSNPLLGQNAGSAVGLSAKAYQAALAKEGRNVSPDRYNELRNLRELGKKQNLN